MTPDKPDIPGDNITGNVGEGAQNTAIGKNIVQIIIDKLHLPLWLLYSFAAAIVVIASGMSWFTWQSNWGAGILVALPSTPTPTATFTPSPTPLAFKPEQADEVLIVIATFDRGEGIADSRLHAEIRRAIQEQAAALDFANLRVEVEPTVLQAADRARAETLGARYNASLVIWGEESSVRITVNFLNRKEPDFEASEVEITETERTFLAATVKPDPYIQFVTADLPQQLTFLTLFAVGQSFSVENQYSKAINIIEHAVSTLSNANTVQGVAAAYFRLGWLYNESLGSIEVVVTAYSQAIALDPAYTDAYINRGTAYMHLQKNNQAMADYDQAIHLEPNDPFIYVIRGTAYLVREEYERAGIDFDKAIQIAPQKPYTHFFRGLANVYLGEYKRAIANYDEVIQLTPQVATLYQKRGGLYAEVGEYEQAIADYDKAIELDPDYATAYNNRGVVYQNLSEYAQAIADYDKAIGLDPDYATAYFNRGSIHDDLDEYAQAMADYDKAVELDPDYATAYFNRGSIHDDLGEYEQAIADYDKAIELDPDYAAAYNNRGVAYQNLSEYAQAVADYDNAIELDPDYATAYFNRGSIHDDLDEYAQAIADYDKAIELDPDYATAYFDRGIVYANLDEHEQALADFSKAIELDPDFTEAYGGRGIMYYNLDNRNKAISDLIKSCQLGALSGNASYVLNLCDFAIEIATEVGAHNDERGLARALTGDLAGAIEDFTAYVEWSKENDEYEPYGKKREAWIAVLKRGENPFDEATLAELREE